jgi:hypothetical protein
VTLHSGAEELVLDGLTHDQFVRMFHAIGKDRDDRVVINTGSADAFMDTIDPNGFDSSRPSDTTRSRGKARSGHPSPRRTRYTRTVLTQRLRRLADEGAGYGTALEVISAADAAHQAGALHRRD